MIKSQHSHRMSPSPEVVGRIVPLILRIGIEPVVLGGMAMRIWGSEKPTPDVDFLALWSRRQLADLRCAVKALGGHWGPNIDGDNPLFSRETRFRFEGVRVDLIQALNWKLREALAQARTCYWNGLEIPVAPLEYVILLKLDFGRPKDFEDVRYAIEECSFLVDRSFLNSASKSWGIFERWTDVGTRHSVVHMS